MSSLAERLALLRKQAGVDAPATSTGAVIGTVSTITTATRSTAPSDPVANSAVSNATRLRRLLAWRPTVPSLPRAAGDAVALHGHELVAGLRYVEQRIVADSLHALRAPRWPEPDAIARERFLCFDSETTGLSGGSGTRAFMLGAADWHDGALRVRQLYLTSLAAEAAMLDAFAGWIDASTVLVSYNGRSYDAPLLATRYRLARRANPLADRPHVDLLHPVRRVYRGVWENCRLATIERQVLRIVREDDLPGAQAPAAWLSYLRHGTARNLMRVLEHNRQDVVTLARLLEHMHTLEAT